MRLLVDMNLSPRWVRRLEAARFEAAHWSTLGGTNASDTQIMEFARAGGYIVLSHDLDFSAILAATGGDRPSVAQVRAENIDPDVIGAAVIDALKQVASELEAGALLTIDSSRARLRLLPLLPK